MSEITTIPKPLDLDSLPEFSRNKPNDEELFGLGDGIPPTERGMYAQMVMLSAGWHDQYARKLDRRVTDPEYDAHKLTTEQAVLLTELAEEVRIVAALIRIVEQGPGPKTMPGSGRVTPVAISEFVAEHPLFYIAAQRKGQKEKDPRLVAKVEEVKPTGYNFRTREISLELIVSNGDAIGTFPKQTKNWRMAHLVTSHVVNLQEEFRYLNTGRR